MLRVERRETRQTAPRCARWARRRIKPYVRTRPSSQTHGPPPGPDRTTDPSNPTRRNYCTMRCADGISRNPQTSLKRAGSDFEWTLVQRKHVQHHVAHELSSGEERGRGRARARAAPSLSHAQLHKTPTMRRRHGDGWAIAADKPVLFTKANRRHDDLAYMHAMHRIPTRTRTVVGKSWDKESEGGARR